MLLFDKVFSQNYTKALKYHRLCGNYVHNISFLMDLMLEITIRYHRMWHRLDKLPLSFIQTNFRQRLSVENIFE
jgi:hypothetical protein